MNILETLVQLRDDIKTWVTNNLQALNTKIDEKTIPVDSELSATSTNPVQNKAIADALAGKQPVGDYALKSEILSTEGLATETYVDTKVAGLVDSAPETLDTLNELAAALGDDPNFATTVATKLGELETAVDNFEIPNSNLVNGTAYGSLRALGTIAESEDYILGEFAFAEGWETKAPGFAAHAEGEQSVAEGNGSHAEGGSQALGQHSHSEGSSKANGANSHAEGSSEANGDHSHAEGSSEANGNYSHTEGCGTKTYGNYSHAEGFDSVAFGAYSHVGGRETFANGRSMVVIGEYNTGDRPDRYELSTTTITNYQIRNMRAMASSVAPTYSEDENRFIWEDYTKMEPSQALNQYYFISHTAYAYVTSCTIDNMSAYISGTLYRMEDLTEKRGDYVVVVGNGMGGSGGYSNAHTLSWDGTAWFQGDVYVGSTSGTNKDEGSKKLATEEYVNNAATPIDATLTIEGAAADAKAVSDAINAPKDYILLTDQVTTYTYRVEMRNGNLISYCDEIESISVSTMPTNVEYTEGDVFDPTGMVIMAICKDGSTREITNYTYSNSPLEFGNDAVEITYEDKCITYKTSVPVTIKAFDPITGLIDFNYTDNGNGTYTITGWKGTYSGKPSTEIIIPNSNKVVV